MQRHFHLRDFSTPVKVLFTCLFLTLGIGYLFAILYLYLIEIEPHTKEGDNVVEAVIHKYYGKRGETRLGASLNGAMGDNITPAQKEKIFQWLERGAKEKDYEQVEAIFKDHCAICHSADMGMPTAPLTSFEEVSQYTAVDMGQSVKTLVRVSHVHLFGMSFIFFLTGGIFGIFAFSEVDTRWRILLIATPFIAIWVDIGSWWFTKLRPVFAYTVIIGGIFMGVALLFQILISLWEMWFKKVE